MLSSVPLEPAATEPKVVFHIGLPKTGTTTLQADVFPFIAEKSAYRYIGLWQPQRKIKQHPLMSAIYRWFANGEGFPHLSDLLREMSHDSLLLISNECVLSTNIHSDWQLRVQRLARLLDDHEITFYLTVREPTRAMFSYYVEHHLDAPAGHYRGFSQAVERDPRLEIYRYGTLFPTLEAMLGRSIIVEAYEDVFAGKSDFLASLTADGKPFPESIGRHNAKRTTTDVVVAGNAATLRDRLRQTVYATPIGRSRWARRAVASLAPITSSLDRVKLGPAGVPKPSASDFATLRAALRDDVAYLRERFGIDYTGEHFPIGAPK